MANKKKLLHFYLLKTIQFLELNYEKKTHLIIFFKLNSFGSKIAAPNGERRKKII